MKGGDTNNAHNGGRGLLVGDGVPSAGCKLGEVLSRLFLASAFFLCSSPFSASATLRSISSFEDEDGRWARAKAAPG